MELLSTINLVALTLILLIVPKIYRVCRILVWQPLMLSRRFKKQGISGPKYRIFQGNLREIRKMKEEAKLSVLDPNSNDIIPRVLPHLHQWMSQYGKTFLYWQGTVPRLCISDHELAKHILSNKFGFFVKTNMNFITLKMAGNGLVSIMAQMMVDCTLRMFEEWKKQRNESDSEQVVMINRGYKRLTADIIATAALGISYAEGIELFKSQKELQKCAAASVTDIYILVSQYLPTPLNLQIRKLDKKVNDLIKRIIDAKLKSESKCYGNHLLGIMLTAARSEEAEKNMSIDEIIEECKTFFFAGHESTANLLTWSTMLLSLHQDWQEKLREEVFKECGQDKNPDSDTCSKLKLMNMVFMESLRLYGPGLNMFRVASEDMKLGNIEIPKGTGVTLPIAKMHRDKAVWGNDADIFNPMRFANGVSRAANHPNALLAFSFGPRACIGQNFAMLEAKISLAMILQRFRVKLSGEYKHAPVDHITLQPQYDLPVILQRLSTADANKCVQPLYYGP